MKLWKYFKEKFIFLVFQSSILVFLAILLQAYNVNAYATILIAFTVTLLTVGWLAFDYYLRYRYYKKLLDALSMMDKKYLIGNLLEEPYFSDAEILCDVIKSTTKAMNDEIARYEILQDEYRKYIETWIHEVKTPLACIDLICKNNRNDVTQKIEEETLKIDNYVEQALFYARSTNVAADYSIKKLCLEDIVKNTIKKHSKQLIASGAHLYFEMLDCTVYADDKWLDFIIGQIIANSIKYKKENLKLFFTSLQNKENIVLSIRDNGIGILESDLSRVFEKGFTGKNGRTFAKSTGIGLYLCRTLCEKMYLGLEIESSFGEGTTVKIIFPKDRASFLS
ncbi:MAG: sensor histidine kinase [Anaerovorax sp.]|nr:sensor histidine kinase [Anaerovorax sp.]